MWLKLSVKDCPPMQQLIYKQATRLMRSCTTAPSPNPRSSRYMLLLREPDPTPLY